jgi:hypothetical protein
VVLADAGLHARVAAEVEALVGEKVEGDPLYNLACCLALSVGPARADAALPMDQRATLAERYAGRAVALLQRLQANGYFKGPQRVEMLKTDTDLEVLRLRADFREVLRQVEAGSPK